MRAPHDVVVQVRTNIMRFVLLYLYNVTAVTFSLLKLAAAVVGRYVVFVCQRHVPAGRVCEWKVDARENMHTIR